MLGVVVGDQSLRRRQNGGQGADKAFGAVEMGIKLAQNWLTGYHFETFEQLLSHFGHYSAILSHLGPL